jgi:sigma-B regulation protein RsbQ
MKTFKIKIPGVLLLFIFHFSVAQTKISYNITGSGDTTLLFIHGWNIDRTYWASPTEKLTTRFKIATLDLPGHGQSKNSPAYTTPDAMVQEITKMIFKENLTNMIVIGHSMGGELALMLWLKVPDRVVGIIGVDNFKDLEFRVTELVKKQFNEYVKKLEKDYPNMAEQFARENIRSTDSAVVKQIVSDYRNANPRVAVTIFKAMLPQYDYDRTIIKALPFPLHIIASDYEPYNEEALQAYAKSGYHIEWVKSAGHFPMVEQPEQFQEALERTLARINQQKSDD